MHERSTATQATAVGLSKSRQLTSSTASGDRAGLRARRGDDAALLVLVVMLLALAEILDLLELVQEGCEVLLLGKAPVRRPCWRGYHSTMKRQTIICLTIRHVVILSFVLSAFLINAFRVSATTNHNSSL